jgi:nitroreductase
MEVFDAIETCRAIRYFKKDPVAPELIEKIIFAATRSPSPGNT